MVIKKYKFGDSRIDVYLSAIFKLDIKAAYWNEVENKYGYGLVITAPQEFIQKTLKSFVPIRFTSGKDAYIEFDDSIAFLKMFKKKCQPHCIDEDVFVQDYRHFLNNYIFHMPNFLLTSKLKPSVIAEELLGKPIDLLNIENFKKTIWHFPLELKKALIKERRLMHYEFAYGSNRNHIIKFSLDDVRTKLSERDVSHFDKCYAKLQRNGIKGDALKAAILANIQKEISAVPHDSSDNFKAVNEKYHEIKNRYDYKLLGQSQGITTKLLGIFGVKTSSVQALDKWMNFTYPELIQFSESSNRP